VTDLDTSREHYGPDYIHETKAIDLTLRLVFSCG